MANFGKPLLPPTAIRFREKLEVGKELQIPAK